MAGITRLRWTAFTILNFLGATVFTVAVVVSGMIFHNAIDDVVATLNALGEIGALLVVLVIVLYVAVKAWERAAFTRQLQMDRISVDELAALMDGGNPPIILDVRSPEARARDGVIPGSLSAHPTDMNPSLNDLNKDSEVVLYCACPNEASAAIAAIHLKRAGFRRIRPLRGGVDAWLRAGHRLAAT
jgi:rhodanese-related sulfurtransferase